jgi:hypothetical protein
MIYRLFIKKHIDDLKIIIDKLMSKQDIIKVKSDIVMDAKIKELEARILVLENNQEPSKQGIKSTALDRLIAENLESITLSENKLKELRGKKT